MLLGAEHPNVLVLAVTSCFIGLQREFCQNSGSRHLLNFAAAEI